MVDIDLLVDQLRKHGHTVESVYQVPSNAGNYELIVDGVTMDLEAARDVLAASEG